MMTECTLGPTTVYIQDNESGEMLELGSVENLELEEIQIERDSYAQDLNYIRSSQWVSLSYKLKKISKKKFIKLLMARKLQRNVANELAKYFLNKRGYYSYIDLFLLDGGMI